MKLGDYYEGHYRGYYAHLAPGTARGYDGDWLLGDDPNPDRYARRLRAWCKRRGLPYVAPKYFRHTFRTLHAMAGTA